MDVRVIIACRPDDGCRVSVAASRSYGRVWLKAFKSKDICLTELSALGLLTSVEVAEVRASDFDKRDSMLIFHAVAEPETLLAADFELK